MQIKCLQAGIPFDVTDVLSTNELQAFCVIIGELEGGEFNWDAGVWKEPER